MKSAGIGIGVIICALLAIAAPYCWPEEPWIFYIFKPATTVLILLLALFAPNSRYKIAVVVGLLFSLMGDIFLMLPSDQFLIGLICFLITHICYIIAFRYDSRFGRPLWPYLLLATIGIIIFMTLSGGIEPSMQIPVAIYAGALSFMTAQAIARNLQQRSTGSLFAASGAVLFLISDTLLAYDRFLTPFAASQAVILASYYSAQYFVALSAVRKSA